MANVLSTTVSNVALFPPELSNQVFLGTRGKSVISQLCAAQPVAFNGNKEFTFSLDKEIDLVAENGAKGVGGATVGTRTITPLKVEYGIRVSDEFMYASEEARVDFMAPAVEGFARKLARGLDLMAIHGINPRTAAAATLIGTNCFNGAVTQSVTKPASNPPTADALVESAIALVQGNDLDVTGLAMAPALRSDLAAMTTSGGAKMFPELAWGNAPGAINGLSVGVNSTVSAVAANKLLGIVGDFQEGFRWGYAKDISMEIIPYGNPDNDATLGDLKGHNQIYLRFEAYLGWAVLEPAAFALIKSA